jgi:hypothetical protein
MIGEDGREMALDGGAAFGDASVEAYHDPVIGEA